MDTRPKLTVADPIARAGMDLSKSPVGRGLSNLDRDAPAAALRRHVGDVVSGGLRGARNGGRAAGVVDEQIDLVAACERLERDPCLGPRQRAGDAAQVECASRRHALPDYPARRARTTAFARRAPLRWNRSRAPVRPRAPAGAGAVATPVRGDDRPRACSGVQRRGRRARPCRAAGALLPPPPAVTPAPLPS